MQVETEALVSKDLPGGPLPGGHPGPPGAPQTFRWTEDWSAEPAPDASLVDKIRHIPLGPSDTYLSIGGEVRTYYTDWRHSTLGVLPNDNNDPLQLRLRLLADLHLGTHVRAFVELGDNREFGGNLVTPPNRDKLDVQQAFVDLTLPLGDAGQVTLRPGRFEMPLGNGKLVGLREGLDTRFTYQGVRATYILPGTVTVDMFAVRPVNLKPGSLDDGPSHASSFGGVYVSIPRGVLGLGTDVYWYKVNRNTAVLAQGTGEDHRNNWGVRLWRQTAHWDLDLEGNYQSGTFAETDISAWAVLFEGGFTFAEMSLQPRLGLRANIFSGDRDQKDGKAGTFVAAFPRLPVISEAAFFNLSNLMDLYPSVTFNPRKGVTVMVGPDFLWRNSRGDGIYLGSTNASFAAYKSSRFTGTDLNLEAAWQATKRLELRLFETYFAASSSFARDRGKNGNYVGLQSDYRF
ncbi:alginate export family protein [Sphingomonas sp. 10B4]|uniref:alginate export family protein n=1 Tax=Sphingomonas sp. 10B4 TaxID=3048575 RepID=UPI002AB59866|nr:alginate export family protein [Sphingomonas sp. 10B4]MDY7526196.1 alginate export family protein [Sphingomonas sp. 10B4]MEB0283838.1 alginate export family protein [Sphingomonas sp. 10B4]